MTGAVHEPVMVAEVVRLLLEAGADLVVDATLGAGGHSAAFLAARGETARVVGLDRDGEMVLRARERLKPFGERATLVNRSFAEIETVLDELGLPEIDGAVFDLGASSVHFDEAGRGFSFLAPGPLDMRYDRDGGETAEDIVNGATETELADILHEYGDERRARRVARAIVAARPVKDTLRLADVVAGAVGRSGRIHPATRTFQALRVAVNRELEHVDRGIPGAVRRLRTGGRVVAISFHSGEDGRVKRLFREEAAAGRVNLLAKKPLRPTPAEVRANPRARSARLRACERVEGGNE